MFVKLFALMFLPICSWAQLIESLNKYEVNLYFLATSAKYQNGVGVSYPSGITEHQSARPGFRLQVRKTLKINDRSAIEPGISVSYFTYRNEFNYPPDYVDPRILSSQYKYWYASLDNRILVKVLDKPKLEISPFLGFYMNILLSSGVNSTWQMNGQTSNNYLKLTSSEESVNFNYEAGLKFTICPEKKHPVVLSANYNHFLNEQFGFPTGKRNFSWGFSVGYRI